MVSLMADEMIEIFGHFNKPGLQGGVQQYYQNLLEGFKVAGVATILHTGSGRRNRFMEEQIDLLRCGKGNFLFPNYFHPPVKQRGQTSTVVVHDLLYKRFASSLPKVKVAWLNFALPLSLTRADRVVCISEATRSDVMTHFGRFVGAKPLAVIHNPISLNRLKGGVAVSGLAPQAFVLCPSSGFWHKNVPYLVRLFKERLAGDGLELVVTGQRPSQMGWSAATNDFRRSYDQMLRESTVRELGYVSDAQLGWLYANAAAVVFPSKFEGFGMPVFEAAAMGAQVVCHAVGAVPELPSKAINVVPFNDDDAWVRAIRRATQQDERGGDENLSRQLAPKTVAGKYADFILAGGQAGD